MGTDDRDCAMPAPLATASKITKHSVIIGERKTSVSLEDDFWAALRKLAADRREPVHALVARLAKDRPIDNLSSWIRVCLFRHARAVPVMQLDDKDWVR
jgi:predicted DNA-binding ribbon-helix-helix protein